MDNSHSKIIGINSIINNYSSISYSPNNRNMTSSINNSNSNNKSKSKSRSSKKL